MSNASLIRTAGVLALLIAGLGVLGAQRLGWLRTEEAPSWEYHNALIDCARGTRSILRPGRVDQESLRYWFVLSKTEPLPDDEATGDSPVGSFAHMRAAIGARGPEDPSWYYNGYSFFAYRQLGTMTHLEWLEEISLVEESDGEGGSRTMLRALFQSPGGATSWYLYDPAKSREERAKSGFGWERVERHASEQTSEVYFLAPAGLKIPSAAAEGGKPGKDGDAGK